MRTDIVNRVVRQVRSFVSNGPFVGKQAVERFKKSESLRQEYHAV